MIIDSGERREFETGAVRDIQEGKGRCDLLPLDVISKILDITEHDKIISNIHSFQETGNYHYLIHIISIQTINKGLFPDIPTLVLEVSKHFEEGAKKYGEYNWQKGIPVKCYIDSAVRHYLKWLRCDQDERHDRAFCWNIICAIWTCINKPELNDYAKEVNINESN